MMTPPSRCCVLERGPETPLRLEIAPGVIAAHAGQTVVILEPLDGSEVRVRDVASGIEKIVPVCELSGAALGLSRKDTQRRLETLRRSSRHPETASAIVQRAGSTCDPSDRGEISGSPQDEHLWAERGNPHSMPSRLTEAGFS